MEYADSTSPHALQGVPATLQALVDTVPTMAVVEYADSTFPRTLQSIPSALQSLVNVVPKLAIIEYANSTSGMELAYPVGFFNDTSAPQISGVAALGSGIIIWSTDEFADSAVMYGTQSGVYPHMVSDLLYTKQHRITLTELTPGTMYYYRVRSTDRSGNTATSSEHSFVGQLYVYLPLVMRSN